MLRFLKYLFFLTATLIVLAIAATGGALYYFVAVNHGPEIEESYIEGILGRESPVFYRDGREKIGVFFQDIHRQYLPYDRIPKNFVNAIIAAEDDQFFDHFGIDIPGIIRALIENIKAGRIVQGGSTITQQTAKNLFKRESRSYKEKLKELLFALRLEYHYPKEKILEFYTNQFFVSGNGHGLGVAARYYFDKDVEELNILECAFIAGSVKRPNYYNPFTKKNKQKTRQARRRAEERAGYVLGKMLKSDVISKLEHDNARESDIVFNQGKMTFALNTVMDLVEDGLKSPEITEALEEHGIFNVSTSGINIVTSVDRELQGKTLYGLRRHLSRLDVRLRGYDREAVQKEYASLQYSGDNEVRPLAFLFGTITEITQDPKSGPLIRVTPGPKQPDGVIDRQGLERMLTAVVKHRENRWAEAGNKHLPLLLKQLQEGDRVYVSVREIDLTGMPRFDLERFPEVQGGALVVQQGGIRSMAGGMENRYFNRAVDARRLMGSTFKPLLFAAALQLGWNSVDMLDNRRNVFVFMDSPYFPRPDHQSPHDFVSMSCAGVSSENVAAVWLLYHLADYLTPPRLREVAAHLDLAPRTEDGESYQLFRSRIRDRYGIQVNRDALEQAAYDNAVKALEADFLFDNRARDYAQLKNLPFGLNFDRYADEIKEDLKNTKLKEKERNELKLRQKILRKSYLGLEPVVGSLREQQQYVTNLVERERGLFSFLNRFKEPLVRPEGNFVRGPGNEIIYTLRTTLPDDWVVMPDQQIIQVLLRLDEEQVRRFWNSVQLEGVVCACAFEQVRSQMERERETLFSQQPYSLEVLGSIRDYRVMVGLRYLLELGKECGIDSRLEPVLSFPLGSNVITLAEAVRMYETLVTGKLYKVDSVEGEESEEEGNGELREGLTVIDRIEAPGGKVVYSRKQGATRVFDPVTSAAVTSILQNVISYGTGRYARDTVRLKSMDQERQKELEQIDLPIPLMGKTGTANRFRNAAFIGYVPTRSQKNESVMVLDGGYSVGVYVGYDNNKPMTKGTTRITGSSGALPVWSDIAGALLVLDEVGEHLDPVDLTFNGLGLKYPATEGMFVPVDPEQGYAVLPGRGARRSLIPPDSPVILSQGRVTGNGHFEPTRSFMPFWQNSTPMLF